MAKRTMNRKEQRLPMDDYEQEVDEMLAVGDDSEDDEDMEKKSRKKVKKVAAKRSSKASAGKEVRLKAFWAVYSQALACVKLFEYGDKESADKLAEDLSESKKAPHFVRLEKKVIE